VIFFIFNGYEIHQNSSHGQQATIRIETRKNRVSADEILLMRLQCVTYITDHFD